jgi:hypothetical protein
MTRLSDELRGRHIPAPVVAAMRHGGLFHHLSDAEREAIEYAVELVAQYIDEGVRQAPNKAPYHQEAACEARKNDRHLYTLRSLAKRART